MIKNFNIHSKFPESDHLPVIIDINVNISNQNTALNQKHNGCNWSSSYRYVWNDKDIEMISSTLNDPTSSQFYDEYLNAVSMHADTDILAHKYTDYLIAKEAKKGCKIFSA